MDSEKEFKEYTASNHAKCTNCGDVFGSVTYLSNHIERCHTKQDSFECKKCKVKNKTVEELREHIQNIHDKGNTYDCHKCGEKFKTNGEFDIHRKSHSNHDMEAKFPCQKCDKIYSTMNKLRRHDWRSHREINCNRCGENIASREDLKEHREVKHEMVFKVYCRYYPNCSDDDECLYLHEKTVDKRNDVCVDGSSCRDQSCRFSDKEHKENKILCKFQRNCNRLNCTYKHIIDRKAFLDFRLTKESLR